MFWTVLQACWVSLKTICTAVGTNTGPSLARTAATAMHCMHGIQAYACTLIVRQVPQGRCTPTMIPWMLTVPLCRACAGSVMHQYHSCQSCGYRTAWGTGGSPRSILPGSLIDHVHLMTIAAVLTTAMQVAAPDQGPECCWLPHHRTRPARAGSVRQASRPSCLQLPDSSHPSHG